MKHTYFWVSALLATTLINPAYSMEAPTPKAGKPKLEKPSRSYKTFEDYLENRDLPLVISEDDQYTWEPPKKASEFMKPSTPKTGKPEAKKPLHSFDKFDDFLNEGDDTFVIDDKLDTEETPKDIDDNERIREESHPLDKTFPKGLHFGETAKIKAENEKVWEESHRLDKTLPKGLYPNKNPLNKKTEKGFHQKSPDTLDTEYFNYMKTSYPDLVADLDYIPIKDPKEFFEQQTLNTKNLQYLPGKYAIPNKNNFFASTYWTKKMAKEFHDLSSNTHDQGWKIHISAMPESAQKIAELVLPAINGLPHQKGEYTSFKIIPTLPLMRALWTFQYVRDKETQPGKFIVLYPESPDHAYELAKKIDGILNKALNEGILQKSDFLPMIGDVQVGTSGGVYTRFGKFQEGNQLTKITPDGQVMPAPSDNSFFRDNEYDDRFHPWPDFMNKSNKHWSHQKSPFRELPLTWTSFTNPNAKITSWDTRPSSWSVIESAPK